VSARTTKATKCSQGYTEKPCLEKPKKKKMYIYIYIYNIKTQLLLNISFGNKDERWWLMSLNPELMTGRYKM
jgi:hypothetical protein